MFRVQLLIISLLLTSPSLADSCGVPQMTPTHQAEDRISEGVYQNHDPGFSYVIPRGISPSMERSRNNDGSYVVLTGTGPSARISLTVRSGDNSLVTTEGHLRRIAKLSGTQLGKISTLPFDTLTTTETWYRADYKSLDKGRVVYGSLVSVGEGQHWLDWTFTARSKKKLELLVASLATVKLYMSAGVSSCLDITSVTRYRVPGTVMQQYLRKTVAPVYPHGWHGNGTVVLQAAIDTNGKVTSLRVISGDNADIADSAVAAARQYEYQPYTLNQQPVDVDTEITIEFTDQPPSN